MSVRFHRSGIAFLHISLYFKGMSTHGATKTLTFRGVDGAAGGAEQYKANDLSDLCRRVAMEAPLQGARVHVSSHNESSLSVRWHVGTPGAIDVTNAVNVGMELSLSVHDARTVEVQQEVLDAMIGHGASPESTADEVIWKARHDRITALRVARRHCPNCGGDGHTTIMVQWSDGLGLSTGPKCQVCGGTGERSDSQTAA